MRFFSASVVVLVLVVLLTTTLGICGARAVEPSATARSSPRGECALPSLPRPPASTEVQCIRVTILQLSMQIYLR